MCYARTTQQTSDAEPTLAQRWFTVYDAGPTPHQNRSNVSCPPGTTYENIESRSPGKTQTTTQSGFTAGPPFRTPAQQQNNIGPMPASSRAMQASASKNPEPKSAQKLDHRLRRWPNNAPAQAQSLPSQTRKRPANVGTMLSQRLRRWPNTAVTPAARLASAGLCLHGAYKCCYTLKVKWRTLNHNTKTKAGQCLTVDKTHKRKMLTHLTIYLPVLIIYEQAQQIKAQFWSWKMINKS